MFSKFTPIKNCLCGTLFRNGSVMHASPWLLGVILVQLPRGATCIMQQQVVSGVPLLVVLVVSNVIILWGLF